MTGTALGVMEEAWPATGFSSPPPRTSKVLHGHDAAEESRAHVLMACRLLRFRRLGLLFAPHSQKSASLPKPAAPWPPQATAWGATSHRPEGQD